MFYPRRTLIALSLAALSACGTTYSLPEINEETSSRANLMFAEARAQRAYPLMPDSVSIRRFQRVAARIEPVAERFCEREMAERQDFNCDVRIGLDDEMDQPNAYFTFEDGDQPTIRVTRLLLHQIQNDHELAFVLGHEYGHLIGDHITKQRQQAVAGMLIMGAIAGAAQANNPYLGDNWVADNMEIGMQIGGAAFSQTYELESDTVGTLIARSAGYDPAIGAKFFARSKAAKTPDGALSFWGTHPPDEKRVATVLATLDQIEAQGGISRKGN